MTYAKVSCACYCVHATTHREIPDIFCRLCVSLVHTTLCICTMNIYASATQVTNLHVGHAGRRSRSGRFDSDRIFFWQTKPLLFANFWEILNEISNEPFLRLREAKETTSQMF